MPTDRSAVATRVLGAPEPRHAAPGTVAAAPPDPWARYDALLDQALSRATQPGFENRVRSLAAMTALLEERHGPRPAGAPEHLDLMEELRKLPREMLLEALGVKERKVIRMELRERAKAAGV